MTREQAIAILGEDATEDQIKRLMAAELPAPPANDDDETDDDETDEDETDDDDSDETDDETDEDDEEEDEDEDDDEAETFNGIEVDKLSDEGKMLFKMFMDDKKKQEEARKKELIKSSSLDTTYKKMLLMAAKSASETEVRALIKEGEEQAKAKSRKAGKTKIVPRAKIKKKGTKKSNKAPKPGSKAFGAMLAK
jgi:hypothetical protein